MIGLYALTVIIREDMSEDYLSFLKAHHSGLVISSLCHGTANQRILDLVGLEESNKTIIGIICSKEEAKFLMREMIINLGLELPGCGIAFMIPISSVGGIRSLNLLKGSSELNLNETMEAKHLYELIIAITNHGYSENIMDAARSAGAKGGTVLTAKGTNPDIKELFFGMSIADEKDIVLILTAAVQKNTIMQSIMTKAGIQSPAHTVLFSLPVDDVEGLKSVKIAAGVEEAL